MRNLVTKTKKLAIVALMTFALISVVLVALPIVSANESNDVPEYDDVTRLLQNRRIDYPRWRRDTILLQFIKNGAHESVDGTVIAVTPHILVIEGDGQTLNILMPGKWVFEGEILDAQDLLDGEPFGPQDAIQLETLMLQLEKDDHTITSYLAFSISMGEDSTTALLPFNVETD